MISTHSDAIPYSAMSRADNVTHTATQTVPIATSLTLGGERRAAGAADCGIPPVWQDRCRDVTREIPRQIAGNARGAACPRHRILGDMTHHSHPAPLHHSVARSQWHPDTATVLAAVVLIAAVVAVVVVTMAASASITNLEPGPLPSPTPAGY